MRRFDSRRSQTQCINDAIEEALGVYIAAYPDVVPNADHFVFFNTRMMNYNEPIRRGHAWKIISQVCQDVGLRGDYGTHTLRKTWAYHAGGTTSI
jgi:site-specific recombinase XerD